MSFAKYAQFYKDGGFFVGSKIKTQVTDGTYIGKEMILSKGTDIIQTVAIPTNGKVEFFTDESGELVLSSDNGTAVITATVNITNYATYNVTMHGMSSDNSREAFANDVTMDSDMASANIAYTGDVSAISIVNSNPNLVRATINGNKVDIVDSGRNMVGKCSITATVAATDKYDSADVTFYVNKLTGIYGSWGEASDEIITRMIAEADAGEIDLADFWVIGEERTVHLDAIEAGTEVSAQPEQDITLVLLHNPIDDDYYRLTAPTAGFRYQPNYIIGVKDCLEYPTAMGFIPKAMTATYSTGSNQYTKTNSSYAVFDTSDEAEGFTFLKNKFVPALPTYIQGVLKAVNRRCICADVVNEYDTLSSGYENGYYSYNTQGIQSCVISLMNVVELGFTSNVHREGRGTGAEPYSIEGYGVYNFIGTLNGSSANAPLIIKSNNAVNTCGRKFQYYTNGGSLIKSRNNQAEEYFVTDTFIGVKKYGSSSSNYDYGFSLAYYVDVTGGLSTNDLMSEAQRKAKRGLSPIMFI